MRVSHIMQKKKQTWIRAGYEEWSTLKNVGKVGTGRVKRI